MSTELSWHERVRRARALLERLPGELGIDHVTNRADSELAITIDGVTVLTAAMNASELRRVAAESFVSSIEPSDRDELPNTWAAAQALRGYLQRTEA